MTAITVNPPAVSGDDGSWHNTGAGSISLTAATIAVGDADAANNGRHGWLRYPNVYAFPGQTINTFKVNVRPSGLTGTIPPMTIVGVKQLNPAAPTTRAQANALVLTTATVAWTPGVWTTGVRQDSPELKTILQEIVNQPGWVSGDAVIILLKVVEDVFTTANLLAFNAVDGGVPANNATASGDLTGVSRVDGHSLQYHLNRKAGTLVGGVPTREEQGAANVWAGTTGRDLVGALNVKAGNALGSYRELAGVLNQLAGTTGLEVDGAAASIP